MKMEMKAQYHLKFLKISLFGLGMQLLLALFALYLAGKYWEEAWWAAGFITFSSLSYGIAAAVHFYKAKNRVIALEESASVALQPPSSETFANLPTR